MSDAHPSRNLVAFIGYCPDCDMVWEVNPGEQYCPDCTEMFPQPPEPDRSNRPVLRLIRGSVKKRTPPTGRLCIIVNP